LPVKDFTTAVEKQEETEDESVLVFSLDEFEMRAYRPTEGQFALLMMAMGRHVAETQQASGVLDFFINVLDQPSQNYVLGRMQSRTNAIPMDAIVEILEWMIEEWGGRPTRSPSVSTPSRRNGGRKSTRVLQPSTS
jgi:hypothetical protein